MTPAQSVALERAEQALRHARAYIDLPDKEMFIVLAWKLAWDVDDISLDAMALAAKCIWHHHDFPHALVLLEQAVKTARVWLEHSLEEGEG